MRKPRTQPPADHVLRTVITSTCSLKIAAERLGLSERTAQRHARRLGVQSHYRTHEGMPADDKLFQDLYWCDSFRELADQYRVPEYAVRNEAKRLGVTSPSMRAVYGRTRPVMAPWAQPAA